MKKGINIIQIKGTKGVILAIGIVCCLIAGFVVFPGFVAMYLWNFTAHHVSNIPVIGIFQGVLLWGIVAASYYTFRKEKHVVYMNTPMLEGLSDEELKNVFAEIKRQAQDDPVLQNMIKAREAEFKIKRLKENATEPEELRITQVEEDSETENDIQNRIKTEHKS